MQIIGKIRNSFLKDFVLDARFFNITFLGVIKIILITTEIDNNIKILIKKMFISYNRLI
jgi:hypothetical protein